MTASSRKSAAAGKRKKENRKRLSDAHVHSKEHVHIKGSGHRSRCKEHVHKKEHVHCKTARRVKLSDSA